jgi:hypothetical protein
MKLSAVFQFKISTRDHMAQMCAPFQLLVSLTQTRHLPSTVNEVFVAGMLCLSQKYTLAATWLLWDGGIRFMK